MENVDRQRACDLMIEALAICEILGEGVAAARLQLALDTLRPAEGNRLREEGTPWCASE